MKIFLAIYLNNFRDLIPKYIYWSSLDSAKLQPLNLWIFSGEIFHCELLDNFSRH